MGQFGNARLTHAAMLEPPQDQRQFARRGLEGQRQVDVVGTEFHPELAQLGAGVLIERLDLFGNFGPGDDAEVFGQPESDAAGGAFEFGRL